MRTVGTLVKIGTEEAYFSTHVIGVARVACTSVGSDSVRAGSLSVTRVCAWRQALVDICTGVVRVWIFVASSASTGVTSSGVSTATSGGSITWIVITLVDINARNTSTRVARVAGTSVRSDCICASGISMTLVCTVATLVDIGTCVVRVWIFVTNRTGTCETARSVSTGLI